MARNSGAESSHTGPMALASRRSERTGEMTHQARGGAGSPRTTHRALWAHDGRHVGRFTGDTAGQDMGGYILAGSLADAAALSASADAVMIRVWSSSTSAWNPATTR